MKLNWHQTYKEEPADERLPRLHAGVALRPDHAESQLHDLHVQKMELELRNMELRGSRRLLEESRARYAELYDFAPTALCTLDGEGRIIEANLAFSALFGAEPGAIDRRVLNAAVVPEDRPLLRQHVRRCLAERSRTTVELRLRLKDMGVVFFHAVSAPLIDEKGEAIACKTVLTDISLLKRSEERLRLLAAASACLSSSFDVMHTLSLVMKSLAPGAADLCFVDLFDTEEGLRRVGVAVGDPARRGAAESLARAPVALRIDKPQLVVRGGRELVEQLMVEGNERDAVLDELQVSSLMVAPMMTRDQQLGTLTMVMCGPNHGFTDADLTFCADLATRAAMAVDNARLYQGAQLAIQARQEVLSIVSHDLKTPVTGILLGADVLLGGSRAHGERRKGHAAIERIKRTARAMEHIIDDLLDMGGLDTGHLSLQQSTQCIRSVIAEAIEQLAPLAGEKQLRLSVEHSDARWVRCDPHRVMQVLINVIGNAIKFTPEGGAVVVSVADFEGKIRVSIRDNGPGIPSVALRNLFQRYWQAKETAMRGRGLGLFIAKGIVEAHGGAIWVESMPNEGTVFHFTVPMAPAPESQPTTA